MLNFTPEILQKEIVIISDYDDYESEDEKLHEKMFLDELQSEIEAYGFKYTYIEGKTVEEIAEKLKVYDKNNIIIFNWFEKLYGVPDSDNSETEIVKFLEESKYIFGGGDLHSFLITKDKYNVKQIFLKNSIPTPNGCLLDEVGSTKLNYPVMVKLRSEHCSAGITDKSVFATQEALQEYIKSLDDKTKARYYIEEFVDGEEYTVAAWGNKNPEILPALRVNFPKGLNSTDRILSYDTKWAQDSFYMNLDSLTPAIDLSETDKQHITEVATQAFKVLGVSGFARLDFRLKDGVPYCIDFNINPYIGRDAEFLMCSILEGDSIGDTYLKICQFGFERFNNANNKK